MPASAVANVKGPLASAAISGARAESVLCVANFPANTGYAWDFIESLFAGIANHLDNVGVRTWVAYPEIGEPPQPLFGSAARAIALAVRPDDPTTLPAALRFIRKHNVKVVYLADQPAWHPAYLLMRMAGARRIIAHDHTSGERTVPTGIKRIVKLALRRAFSGMFADVVIGVSDYVTRRKIEVDMVPRGRVRRIWNSLALPPRDDHAREKLRAEFRLTEDTAVVICACRASQYKGVDYLMRAFDRVQCDAVLVYMGDGPDLCRLEQIRSGLRNSNRVVFAGYRADARELIAGADVCVVPSLWQEAFGLAALEPMARSVAVVATRVGGIPEVVVDGETGILVSPGDEAAMTKALNSLLANPAERRRLGDNGRRRAEQHFSIDREIAELVSIIEPVFAA